MDPRPQEPAVFFTANGRPVAGWVLMRDSVGRWWFVSAGGVEGRKLTFARGDPERWGLTYQDKAVDGSLYEQELRRQGLMGS